MTCRVKERRMQWIVFLVFSFIMVSFVAIQYNWHRGYHTLSIVDVYGLASTGESIMAIHALALIAWSAVFGIFMGAYISIIVFIVMSRWKMRTKVRST